MKSIRRVAVKAAVQPSVSLPLQDHIRQLRYGKHRWAPCPSTIKEICSWSGKRMQWLQNLTLVIHVGLSTHFILSELEN